MYLRVYKPDLTSIMPMMANGKMRLGTLFCILYFVLLKISPVVACPNACEADTFCDDGGGLLNNFTSAVCRPCSECACSLTAPACFEICSLRDRTFVVSSHAGMLLLYLQIGFVALLFCMWFIATSYGAAAMEAQTLKDKREKDKQDKKAVEMQKRLIKKRSKTSLAIENTDDTSEEKEEETLADGSGNRSLNVASDAPDAADVPEVPEDSFAACIHCGKSKEAHDEYGKCGPDEGTTYSYEGREVLVVNMNCLQKRDKRGKYLLPRKNYRGVLKYIGTLQGSGYDKCVHCNQPKQNHDFEGNCFPEHILRAKDTIGKNVADKTNPEEAKESNSNKDTENTSYEAENPPDDTTRITYYGIELFSNNGNTDGNVIGSNRQRAFECQQNCGVFVPKENLMHISDAVNKNLAPPIPLRKLVRAVQGMNALKPLWHSLQVTYQQADDHKDHPCDIIEGPATIVKGKQTSRTISYKTICLAELEASLRTCLDKPYAGWNIDFYTNKSGIMTAVDGNGNGDESSSSQFTDFTMLDENSTKRTGFQYFIDELLPYLVKIMNKLMFTCCCIRKKTRRKQFRQAREFLKACGWQDNSEHIQNRYKNDLITKMTVKVLTVSSPEFQEQTLAAQKLNRRLTKSHSRMLSKDMRELRSYSPNTSVTLSGSPANTSVTLSRSPASPSGLTMQGSPKISPEFSEQEGSSSGTKPPRTPKKRSLGLKINTNAPLVRSQSFTMPLSSPTRSQGGKGLQSQLTKLAKSSMSFREDRPGAGRMGDEDQHIDDELSKLDGGNHMVTVKINKDGRASTVVEEYNLIKVCKRINDNIAFIYNKYDEFMEFSREDGDRLINEIEFTYSLLASVEDESRLLVQTELEHLYKAMASFVREQKREFQEGEGASASEVAKMRSTLFDDDADDFILKSEILKTLELLATGELYAAAMHAETETKSEGRAESQTRTNRRRGTVFSIANVSGVSQIKYEIRLKPRTVEIMVQRINQNVSSLVRRFRTASLKAEGESSSSASKFWNRKKFVTYMKMVQIMDDTSLGNLTERELAIVYFAFGFPQKGALNVTMIDEMEMEKSLDEYDEKKPTSNIIQSNLEKVESGKQHLVCKGKEHARDMVYLEKQESALTMWAVVWRENSIEEDRFQQSVGEQLGQDDKKSKFDQLTDFLGVEGSSNLFETMFALLAVSIFSWSAAYTVLSGIGRPDPLLSSITPAFIILLIAIVLPQLPVKCMTLMKDEALAEHRFVKWAKAKMSFPILERMHAILYNGGKNRRMRVVGTLAKFVFQTVFLLSILLLTYWGIFNDGEIYHEHIESSCRILNLRADKCTYRIINQDHLTDRTSIRVQVKSLSLGRFTPSPFTMEIETEESPSGDSMSITVTESDADFLPEIPSIIPISNGNSSKIQKQDESNTVLPSELPTLRCLVDILLPTAIPSYVPIISIAQPVLEITTPELYERKGRELLILSSLKLNSTSKLEVNLEKMELDELTISSYDANVKVSNSLIGGKGINIAASNFLKGYASVGLRHFQTAVASVSIPTNNQNSICLRSSSEFENSNEVATAAGGAVLNPFPNALGASTALAMPINISATKSTFIIDLAECRSAKHSYVQAITGTGNSTSLTESDSGQLWTFTSEKETISEIVEASTSHDIVSVTVDGFDSPVGTWFSSNSRAYSFFSGSFVSAFSLQVLSPSVYRTSGSVSINLDTCTHRQWLSEKDKIRYVAESLIATIWNNHNINQLSFISSIGQSWGFRKDGSPYKLLWFSHGSNAVLMAILFVLITFVAMQIMMWAYWYLYIPWYKKKKQFVALMKMEGKESIANAAKSNTYTDLVMKAHRVNQYLQKETLDKFSVYDKDFFTLLNAQTDSLIALSSANDDDSISAEKNTDEGDEGDEDNEEENEDDDSEENVWWQDGISVSFKRMIESVMDGLRCSLIIMFPVLPALSLALFYDSNFDGKIYVRLPMDIYALRHLVSPTCILAFQYIAFETIEFIRRSYFKVRFTPFDHARKIIASLVYFLSTWAISFMIVWIILGIVIRPEVAIPILGGVGALSLHAVSFGSKLKVWMLSMQQPFQEASEQLLSNTKGVTEVSELKSKFGSAVSGTLDIVRSLNVLMKGCGYIVTPQSHILSILMSRIEKIHYNNSLSHETVMFFAMTISMSGSVNKMLEPFLSGRKHKRNKSLLDRVKKKTLSSKHIENQKPKPAMDCKWAISNYNKILDRVWENIEPMHDAAAEKDAANPETLAFTKSFKRYRDQCCSLENALLNEQPLRSEVRRLAEAISEYEFKLLCHLFNKKLFWKQNEKKDFHPLHSVLLEQVLLRLVVRKSVLIESAKHIAMADKDNNPETNAEDTVVAMQNSYEHAVQSRLKEAVAGLSCSFNKNLILSILSGQHIFSEYLRKAIKKAPDLKGPDALGIIILEAIKCVTTPSLNLLTYECKVPEVEAHEVRESHLDLLKMEQSPTSGDPRANGEKYSTLASKEEDDGGEEGEREEEDGFIPPNSNVDDLEWGSSILDQREDDLLDIMATFQTSNTNPLVCLAIEDARSRAIDSFFPVEKYKQVSEASDYMAQMVKYYASNIKYRKNPLEAKEFMQAYFSKGGTITMHDCKAIFVSFFISSKSAENLKLAGIAKRDRSVIFNSIMTFWQEEIGGLLDAADTLVVKQKSSGNKTYSNVMEALWGNNVQILVAGAKTFVKQSVTIRKSLGKMEGQKSMKDVVEHPAFKLLREFVDLLEEQSLKSTEKIGVLVKRAAKNLNDSKKKLQVAEETRRSIVSALGKQGVSTAAMGFLLTGSVLVLLCLFMLIMVAHGQFAAGDLVSSVISTGVLIAGTFAVNKGVTKATMDPDTALDKQKAIQEQVVSESRQTANAMEIDTEEFLAGFEQHLNTHLDTAAAAAQDPMEDIRDMLQDLKDKSEQLQEELESLKLGFIEMNARPNFDANDFMSKMESAAASSTPAPMQEINLDAVSINSAMEAKLERLARTIDKNHKEWLQWWGGWK